MKKSIVSRFKIQSMVIEQWSNRLLWHWNETREIETKKNPFQLQRRIIFTSSPYSLRKRTRARMAWFQKLRLIARDKSSLPACLQPLFRWNEAGSCGNSPQPATTTTTSSVLFRSMPFPCPQNIRLLIMAPASPPWDSITPSTPLYARSACRDTRAPPLLSNLRDVSEFRRGFHTLEGFPFPHRDWPENLCVCARSSVNCIAS